MGGDRPQAHSSAHSVSGWPASRRGAVAWTAHGTPGLFGGLGVPSGRAGPWAEGRQYLSDSWTRLGALFVPATTTGGGRAPGGREGATVWVDTNTGRVFLFGGFGFHWAVRDDSLAPPQLLNDMFYAEHAAVGDPLLWQSVTYPVESAPPGRQGDNIAPTNAPRSTRPISHPKRRREEEKKSLRSPIHYIPCVTGAASWVDEAGIFWLFGGCGPSFDGSSTALPHRPPPEAVLGDLFRFDVRRMRWSNQIGTSALPEKRASFSVGASEDATTTGVPSAAPGPAGVSTGRCGATVWYDSQRHAAQVFGGETLREPLAGQQDGAAAYCNGVLEIFPNGSRWVPAGGGACTSSLPLAYMPREAPGPRMGATGWQDGLGNSFLFGGWNPGEQIPGLDLGLDPGHRNSRFYNDLWVRNDQHFAGASVIFTGAPPK